MIFNAAAAGFLASEGGCELTPDELVAKDFRVIQSSRRGFIPHGKRDWIAAIKKVYKRDGNVVAKNLRAKYPHLYTQGVWIFGDWDKALLAAGFQPERMRERRSWDQENLINEIQGMRNRRLPLYANYAMKHHGSVFKKALRQYGSWIKALVAAGVIRKQFLSKLFTSRIVILRAIRIFWNRVQIPIFHAS